MSSPPISPRSPIDDYHEHAPSEDEISSDEEDLDKIWSMVETKLRSPFSCLELCKTYHNLPDQHSKRKFLRALLKTFSRMAKPVKLRLLLSLLGLNETSDPKSNSYVYELFLEGEKAEEDEWVRIVSGICQKKLYNREEPAPQPPPKHTLDHILKKTTERVIKEVLQYVDTLAEQEAKEDSDNEGENSEKKHAVAAHDYLYEDRAMQYIPMKYKLLDTELIKELIPECDDTLHFTVKEDAAILKEDGEMERKKVEEEKRDAEVLSARGGAVTTTASSAGTASSTAKSAVASSVGTAAGVKSKNAPVVDYTARKKKSGNSSGSSSMFLRPSRGGATASMLGRGGRGAMAGRMAAGRTGPNSLLAQRRRKLLEAKKAGLASTAGTAAGRGGGRATKLVKSSKMKMIDSNEAAGLVKEQQERDHQLDMKERMSAKRRKIMEAAASTGLKKKMAAGVPAAAATTPDDVSHEDAPVDVCTINDNPENLLQPPNDATMPSNPMLATTTQTQTIPPIDLTPIPTTNTISPFDQTAMLQPPLETYDHPNDLYLQQAAYNPLQQAPQTENWHLLLEQSNKITPEDRLRVEQFFLSRYNPTPEQSVYKMKLHEEKKQMEDGSQVKESLYLELDYNTMGFKKLRKIKKK